jgi:hypothetical protein
MVWLPNDICMQASSVNTMKPASRDNGRKIEEGRNSTLALEEQAAEGGRSERYEDGTRKD